jgi:hypothetical protein
MVSEVIEDGIDAVTGGRESGLGGVGVGDADGRGGWTESERIREFETAGILEEAVWKEVCKAVGLLAVRVAERGTNAVRRRATETVLAAFDARSF